MVQELHSNPIVGEELLILASPSIDEEKCGQDVAITAVEQRISSLQSPPSAVNGLTAAMQDDDDDITCGFWLCRGHFLQKFANKKAYVVLFGILGCLSAASYSYFNGIISTVEKRFGIPSRVVGIITVGNDISSLIVSIIVTYYASKKHQPRWIGCGMYTIVIFCLLCASPHLIYGPGNDAMSHTEEFGRLADNKTRETKLCNNITRTCDESNGGIITPIILFTGQFISGLGATLYHTLGVTYMDDNTSREKTPMMLSFTYFIRSLGPVLGHFISFMCLKLYIVPGLTPTIYPEDPRWLGAWWLGWLVLAFLLFIFATIMTMFPKMLPETAAKRKLISSSNGSIDKQSPPPSFPDMIDTIKRLFTNSVLMCNNLAAVFYLLGAVPFFIFMPKYMEVMYAQSAFFSNLITGVVGIAFGSVGLLLSGYVLSKFKPKARKLAAWNVFIGAVMVACVVGFTFLECSNLSDEKSLHSPTERNSPQSCAATCHCDYVKYSPVCSADGETNFISPCHAGCQGHVNSNTYNDCKCIPNTQNNTFISSDGLVKERVAYSGPCHVDCTTAFISFLAIICFMNFLGATGRTTNFLVAVRCVEEKDKSVSMGIGLTMISLAAFIPSPILFGYIIDRSCIVWGKTCSGKSNCWLYDSKTLRYTMNYTSASFIAIGVIFDFFVWYLAKGIQIFDEPISFDKKQNKDESHKMENVSNSDELKVK